MAGLGRVGTRVVVGAATVVAVALLSWLLTPNLAQGRSAPTAAVRAQPTAGASTPAAVGAASPTSTSAAITPPGATPFEMSYGTRGRQTYLAYLPAVRTTDLAVVLVHGGSWVSGTASDTEEYNQRLFTLGIASFSVDYRLATEAAWPAQRVDLGTALTSIRRRAVEWGFDPAAIAVVGVSAGGHLALDLADQGADRPAGCAVVAYSAPTSMNLILREAKAGKRQGLLARAVRSLAPTEKLRRSASLPHTPGADDAPALLFAGEQEWVDPRHSERFADDYAGVPLEVRSVVLAGEERHASGYALADPQVWSTSLDFIRRHCG